MKKTVSVLLIIAIFVSALFALNVSAEGEKITIDEITYTSFDTYCEVTECFKTKSGDVVIPSSVKIAGKDLPVKSIGESAFMECKKITGVTIPDSVTSIGMGAFWECVGLTGVTIPDSVTFMGNGAFWGSGIYEVKISSGLKAINKTTFACCNNLIDVIIPDGVTSIGESAFSQCRKLSTVTIPTSVTSIGTLEFYESLRLNTIYYKGNEEQWNEINIEMDNDKLLFGTEIIFMADVTIDGITYACYNDHCNVAKCDKDKSGKASVLSSVNFDGKDLPTTKISNKAFWTCKNITDVTIPDSVEEIANSAFFDCDSLLGVSIGSGTVKIGVAAFVDNDSLASITVSKDNPVYHSKGNCIIETSSKTLIIGCKSSVIPGDGSVTAIDNEAFEGCVGLLSILIPKSVTSIGKFAFFGCNNLKTVYYSGSEAEWNEISVGDYNDPLHNAEKVFDYVYSSEEKGDINGDTSVDNKDVVLLFRYVSGSNSGYDPLYDFNEDGLVDNKDVVALFRVVSGSN